MGAAEAGEQMMTEKRDKPIEALMPEEQQNGNALLAKSNSWLLDSSTRLFLISVWSRANDTLT
jgi:hypothetical protein